MTNPKSSSSETSVTDVDVSSTLVTDELYSINRSLPYHTRLNPPKKIKFKSDKPSKVQESPLEARSPQEVLEYHGMYRDPSVYKQNPTKIFADITAFNDYETNLNQLAQAKSKFQELPIDIRAKFNHDVSKFAEYVQSDKFDVEYLMMPGDVKAYRAYLKEQKEKADYEQYLQSEEYKNSVKEAQLRKEYEQSKYEEWKITHKK